MSPKHIIQVSSYYPPHLGGQENAVQDLACQLAGAGHRVEVLTSTEGGGTAGASLEHGVRVNRLSGPVFGHAPILPWLPLILLFSSSAGTVVHLHIGQAFTPEVVWLVSKLRRFKYVAELHIDFEPSGPVGVLLPLYKKFVLKKVLQSADFIVALNEKTLRAVRESYGYTGRAEIMSNGIDDAYFTLTRAPQGTTPPQTARLLFVGRLSKQKNVTALLKALTLTTRPVQLTIVGEGEERSLVEKTIAHYGLTNVTLSGRLDRAEVMRCYETYDALVMPSLYEAQPLVLLEAMAARIPIIGTNVIGVAEHIKNVGIIVEPTAEGLAGGIEQYNEQYSRLPAKIERGRRIADNLRWAHLLGKYEALYEALGN